MMAPGMQFPGAPGGPGPGGPGAPGSLPPPGEVSCNVIKVMCRAVDLGKPEANTRFMYVVEDELKGRPVFVATNMLQGTFPPEGQTFSFQLNVILKHPLKL